MSRGDAAIQTYLRLYAICGTINKIAVKFAIGWVNLQLVGTIVMWRDNMRVICFMAGLECIDLLKDRTLQKLGIGWALNFCSVKNSK